MQRRNFLGLSLTLVSSSVLASAAKTFYPTNPLEDNKIKDLSKLLVLNTKTNTIHFKNPLATKYKHFIAAKNAKVISVSNWNNEVNALEVIKQRDNEIPPHFDKAKSGFILENLALKELATGINPVSLNAAMMVLSQAFNHLYVEYNKRNWRLHELLFNLVACNDNISDKWASYEECTKLVDLSEISVPSRNEWVFNREKFNEKLDINSLKKDLILQKLNKRIII